MSRTIVALSFAGSILCRDAASGKADAVLLRGMIGTLEPGKRADLVIIDRDDLACPKAQIRLIKPLRSRVGGRTVLRR